MTMTLRKLLPAATAAACSLAFASTAQAQVGPGVQMYTDGAQCTANFVFSSGTTRYLGYAAHCAGTGSSTDTNGCETRSLPLGTRVEIVERDGDSVYGTLAYSSWKTMRDVGERDRNACEYNDFALVKLPSGARVSSTMPFWGGPTGLRTTGFGTGADVFSFGNSGLRLGIEALSPKRGKTLGTSGGGWTHTVYTATPGIPGDSGSGFVDRQGKAFGVTSTVALAPFAGSNGISDLNKSMNYAKSKGGLTGLTLVNGGRFSPIL